MKEKLLSSRIIVAFFVGLVLGLFLINGYGPGKIINYLSERPQITAALITSLIVFIGALRTYEISKKQISLNIVTNSRLKWLSDAKQDVSGFLSQIISYTNDIEIFTEKNAGFSDPNYVSYVYNLDELLKKLDESNPLLRNSMARVELTFNLSGEMEEVIHKMIEYISKNVFLRTGVYRSEDAIDMILAVKEELKEAGMPTTFKDISDEINSRHSFDINEYDYFNDVFEFVKTDIAEYELSKVKVKNCVEDLNMLFNWYFKKEWEFIKEEALIHKKSSNIDSSTDKMYLKLMKDKSKYVSDNIEDLYKEIMKRYELSY